ncbi:MAG: hypothetical protein IKR85_06620 [Clostridia bacterium]|nr:hypothetical protein [Clostridia bacterium]
MKISDFITGEYAVYTYIGVCVIVLIAALVLLKRLSGQKAKGRLIVEVYDLGDGSSAPGFSYTQCALASCFPMMGRRSKKMSLANFWKKGLMRAAKDKNVRKKLAGQADMLAEAGFSKIDLVYNAPTQDESASVDITNISRRGIQHADSMYTENGLILYDSYRFNETDMPFTLRDGQRITLEFNTRAADTQRETDDGMFDMPAQMRAARGTIKLNLTYLEN